MNILRPFRAPALLAVFAAALLAATMLVAPTADSAKKKPQYKNKIFFKKVTQVASPTSVTAAPGFGNLLFITSRMGKIRVMREGRMLAAPLLDLSDKVETLWVEQGLLGLTFAPDFKKTGRYYVHYTAKGGDVKVDEYAVNPEKDPTRTLPASGRNVIRIPKVSKAGNHNGGAIAFLGKFLYIAVGDGNNPGDQQNLAQNLNSLRGKILRIDPRPDQTSGRTYRIPPSNPFVAGGGRAEIFAYGFRNPHSFDFFRPAGDGELQMAITDVGQGRAEEMNVLPFRLAWGANFGWKLYEGTLPYDCEAALCPGGQTPVITTPLIWPALTYSHEAGCAIIGGPYVEDKSLGKIDNRIIYGDFCTNRIRTAAPNGSWITNDRGIGSFLPPGKDQHSALNGFGVGAGNKVYAFSNFGPVYRLVQKAVRVATPAKQKIGCKKKPNQKRCKKKSASLT